MGWVSASRSLPCRKLSRCRSKVLKWPNLPTDALPQPSRRSIARECTVSAKAGGHFPLSPGLQERRSQSVKDILCTGHSIPIKQFLMIISLTGCLGDGFLFISIFTFAHSFLAAAEPKITSRDSIMGDGDCGTTLPGGIDIGHRVSNLSTRHVSGRH